MTETVVEKPTPSITLGGATSSNANNSPRIEDFSTSGGAYREAYDNAAARLGTTDDKRIVAELYREHWSNTATPQDAAQGLIDATAVNGWFSSPEVDTTQMAAEIVAMRGTNPEQAAKVEAEIARRLPDAGFQSRLNEDIRSITEDIGQANNRVQSLGSDATTPPGQITDHAQTTATAEQLLKDATETLQGYRGARTGDYLNVPELAYQVEVLAADNPELAQAVRAELTTRLSPTDSANFNRIIAGDRNFGEGASLMYAHPISGSIGAVKSAANGFIAVGDLMVRGQMLQLAGQQQMQSGITAMLGDEDLAARQRDMAIGFQEAAQSPVIPQIPYANIAESGGADIYTVVDGVMTGRSLIGAGIKLSTREGAEAIVRQADELPEAAPLSGASPDTIVRIAEQQAAVISRLTGKLDNAITGIVGTVDALAAGLARRESEILPTAERLGILSSDIHAIIDLPKTSRPDPSDYISTEVIERHLDMFESEGAIRITSNKYETLARGGEGYVIPKSEYDALFAQTGGNKGQIEEMLGLRHGRLSEGDTIIAWIKPEDMQGLRMPSGNELGANYLWLPGGITLNGVPEAVLDLPKGTPFTQLTIGE